MKNEINSFKGRTVSIAIFLMLTSCSTSSKNDGEVDWSKARGDENAREAFPRAKIANLNLPMVQSKETVLIKGTCLYLRPGDNFGYPLKFAAIKVLKGDKVISETSSDDRGVFVFNLKIPKGEYILQVDSKNYSGESSLRVQRSKHEDVIIYAYQSL